MSRSATTRCVQAPFYLERVSSRQLRAQAGVGTYFHPGVVSPFFRWAAAMLDQAIGWYLSQHVMDGYMYLMQNYNIGDKVCLFGAPRSPSQEQWPS